MRNKITDGNVELLASKINYFFVSVSDHLAGLDRNNEAFDVDGQLPDEYVIDLTTTLQALRKVKTGPDNVPAWILKNHANILAGPLTATFNSSLREGVAEWPTGQSLFLRSHPDVSLVKILLSFTRFSLVQNKCVCCQLRVH